MNNNDVLRRLRYALNINNVSMIEIFKLGGCDITEDRIISIIKKEEEEGYSECSSRQLECFLDGLIISRRGVREKTDNIPVINPDVKLTNNVILKKIRIALDFKEDDMLQVLKLADFETTRHELSALFRSPGSKNYKNCGDQLMKKFLNGLTIKYRK